METLSFKPREMGSYEGQATEFLKAMTWTCDSGTALAAFTYAALTASAAMKKQFGFNNPVAFRKWCDKLPGGEFIDYPFPSAQTNNALIACIEHIKTCQTCRWASGSVDEQERFLALLIKAVEADATTAEAADAEVVTRTRTPTSPLK
jgi:hypothetical protein